MEARDAVELELRLLELGGGERLVRPRGGDRRELLVDLLACALEGGRGLVEPDAEVGGIELDEHAAGLDDVVVVDGDGGDRARHPRRHGDDVRIDVGIVGRHVGARPEDVAARRDEERDEPEGPETEQAAASGHQCTAAAAPGAGRV